MVTWLCKERFTLITRHTAKTPINNCEREIFGWQWIFDSYLFLEVLYLCIQVHYSNVSLLFYFAAADSKRTWYAQAFCFHVNWFNMPDQYCKNIHQNRNALKVESKQNQHPTRRNIYRPEHSEDGILNNPFEIRKKKLKVCSWSMNV